eukprot:TRINITY_DN7180_c3_g1_i1.p1 TRINITY_DN7180_c3_g1~~TRINITY_DN7180_c3_g1_i1.p1  ORF type:complete len:205 (+),score=29.06 TRINITY_DN7180_c3_g1_i1:23-616(+)
MDQYCTVDSGFGQGGLSELHSELYPEGSSSHPGDVYYCLVCRVLLGWPVYTQDGKTAVDSSPLYRSSEKRELAQIPGTSDISYHSLIATTGGAVLRHREFVIFNSNQVKEQYIVAYRREHRSSPSAAIPIWDSEASESNNIVNSDSGTLQEASQRQDALLSAAEIQERLKALKGFKDEGLITEEDYESKKLDLLRRL